MNLQVTRLASWLRLVFPPAYIILGVVVPLLPLDWIYWQFRIRFNQPVPVEITRPRDCIVLAACVLLGVIRVLRFHPFFLRDYCQWLRTTPWQAGKPLPGGPIHLVLQDILPVLLVRLLAPEFTFNILYLPLAYLAGYLVPLALVLRATGVWQAGYLVAFGLGLAVHEILDPPVTLTVAVGCYLIAVSGTRTAWHRDWEPADVRSPFSALLGIRRQEPDMADGSNVEIAWPLDVLAPRLPSISVRRHDAVLLALLAGWWVYVLISIIPGRIDQMNTAVFAISVAILAAPMRLAVYIYRYRSPISLWGRIVRQWGIIPRYDVVFVAPLLAIAIGVVGQGALWTAPLPPAAVAATTIAAVLLVALNAGPSLARWSLTGGHRLRTGFLDPQRFARI
jgi:hypothetical protein